MFFKLYEWYQTAQSMTIGSWDSRMEQLIHFWTLWPNCNSLTNYYHGYYHYYYYFELEVNPEKSKIHSPISGQCFISIPPRNVYKSTILRLKTYIQGHLFSMYELYDRFWPPSFPYCTHINTLGVTSSPFCVCDFINLIPRPRPRFDFACLSYFPHIVLPQNLIRLTLISL